MKRFLRCSIGSILALVVLTIVLVVFLPTIASTGPVRRAIVARINTKLPGALAVKSWTLRWFGGLRMEGLEYKEPGAAEIRIRALSTDLGLAHYARDQRNVGVIRIDGPYVRLPAPTPAGKPPATPPEPVEEGHGAKEPLPGAKAGKAPYRLPVDLDVRARIVVTDGEMLASSAGMEGLSGIHGLQMTLDIPGLRKKLAVDARGSTSPDDRDVGVEGWIRVFSDDGTILATDSEAELKIRADGLSLAPLSSLLAGDPRMPAMAGALQCLADVHVYGVNSVKARGKLRIDDFHAQGGALGSDHPALKTVALEFDVTREGVAMALPLVRFEAGPIVVHASGQLTPGAKGACPEGRISVTAAIDVAALAAQLPATMRMRPGLTLETGSLEGAAEFSADGTNQSVSANVVLSGVAATIDGRKVTMSAPIRAALAGNLHDGTATIDSLEVVSGFGTATAAGTKARFSASVSADLAAAMAEIRQFIDLPKHELAGRVTVDASYSGPAVDRHAISIGLEAHDLRVGGFGPQPIDMKDLNVQLSGAPELAGMDLRSIRDVSLVANAAGIAKVEAKAAQVVVGARGALPRIEHGDVVLTGDLARIAALAQDAGRLPTDIKPSGKVDLHAVGDLDGGALRFSVDPASLDDFSLRVASNSVPTQDVRISAAGEANLSTRALSLREVRLGLAPGEIVARDVTVGDWAAAGSNTALALTVDVDLSKLAAALGSYGQALSGMTLGGKTHANLNVQTRGTVETVKLDMEIRDLSAASGGRPPVREPLSRLSLAGDIDSAAGHVTAKAFSIDTARFAVEASGNLQDWRNECRLSARGDVRIDFTKFAEMLQQLTSLQIEMEGNQKRAFTLETSLRSSSWIERLRQTRANAGVYLSRFKLFGVETGEVDLPLRIADKTATVTLDTALNDGRLRLAPVVRVDGPVPLFTHPAPAQILTAITLNDEICDGLLTKIHPIFKGCSVTEGRIGLGINALSLPLDDTMRRDAALEGTMLFTNVTVKSSGLLQQILGTVRESQEIVRCDNQVVVFSYRNGRIESSPLVLRSGDRTMLKCYGSVGLDETLNYVVELPLTEELVGKQAYPYLKGRSVKAIISGTTSKPRFDSAAVARDIRDQITSVAREEIKKEAMQEGVKLLEGLLKKPK